MAEELRHSNWRELAHFTRAWNDDLYDPQGRIKDAFKTLSPSITEAIRQFVVEVNAPYGFGLSDMSAKEWFNDPGLRAPLADALAAVYSMYQATYDEPADAPSNQVMEELKSLKAELAKLKEAEMPMMDKAKQDEEKAEADEEKAEADEEEAESEDKEA